MSFLDFCKNKDLMLYLYRCSQYTNINVDIAYKAIQELSKNVQNGKFSKKITQLENKWYASLNTNKPYYLVYSESYYFCDLWLCWINYSRKHLKNIISEKSLDKKSIVQDMYNVNKILDLGCGCGYTTATLKEIFVSSKVYGTNIKNTSQYKLAKKLGNTYNFLIIDNLKKVDLIFALEYFEHFLSPISHLIQILLQCNPRYLIIANSFTSKAIGHFNIYIYNKRKYTGREISRLFNKTLQSYGYKKVKTNCWNNRPMYWKRKDEK